MNAADGGCSDEVIAGQVCSGQKELFRLLVRRFQRPVYAMGLSFFRNAEEASDFSQEVFLKVYRSLSRFEGRSRFSTWLYKIAYNTALNETRRRRDFCSLVALNSSADEYEAADNDTPERRMIRAVIKETVLDSIKELPERYRICIDLFFFYDCSYREIQAITGFPVNTVKSHVLRAKKILKEKLNDINERGFWNE